MSVAIAYSKALYEAATEAKSSTEDLNLIQKQLDLVVEFVNTSKEARLSLFGPTLNSSEKITVLGEVGRRASFSPLLLRFFSLLILKGRFPLIEKVRDAFRLVRLTSEGGIAGRLVAADPVSEEDVRVLAEAFTRKLGKHVTFQISTDASLLAGMKVTVNGVTYDGTLRSQLNRLRDRFVFGSAATQ